MPPFFTIILLKLNHMTNLPTLLYDSAANESIQAVLDLFGLF